LVIGFVLQAGMADAQNLVMNPGFETGNTTGWFAFGSPTLIAETSQVHSGTYACLVTNRTGTYMGAAQSFLGSLQSGQTYNVSAWVRLVGSGSQTMQLTMQTTIGGTSTYAAVASGSVSSSAWTQLSGQYTYSPSGTPSALNLYAEMPSSSNVSYYIDDASLTNANPVVVVTNPPINGTSTVDWNNVHQRIDGFGASSAWNSSWTTAEADLLFSTNNNVSYQSGTYNGVGLSLLRNHIMYAGTTSASDTPSTSETSIMQLAQARGARVWSTPWTPAVGFKSTNDIYDTKPITNSVDGGTYLGSGNNITNVNYASQLANYVYTMEHSPNNVSIYAISVQNEPDAQINTYEACQWTGAQFHDFVTNLYSALAARGLSSTKIIIPESQNWPDYQNLAGPSLTDPNVLADVGILADHNYDGTTGPSDLTKNSYGKPLWETEVAILSGSDSSIANGVYYAQRIYLFMTQAQANAYHYWWLVSGGGAANGNEGLLDASAAVTKRLFAFGQYSRFVRPNYYRIDATSSQPSALISAYKDTNSPAFAIVVVNTNTATDVIQTVNLTNFTAASVTPWITSASLSLAPQTPVPLTNASFTYDVPALSVVTFVGQEVVGQSNTPPTIGAVPDQTVNVGVTLLVTNTASDSDVPAQTLTFSPANTFPADATVNSNGLFSWRPLVSQANTTNAIQIQVTDSGSPPLSATNSFNVIVNAVTNPVVGSVSYSPGQVSLTVNGPRGPDYTLWTSTNLVDWQALFITNSPPIPFTVTDTNSTDPARFYKFQIGP
ncbi:MAG TPA: carbohydrate binding domain-containing protein, partial [Verrucomicrobiae bacterium]|nr:carbohydrate binding domain-containing protein [Verrucomicrobiae bacterium]